mgnify:CR=1 FL=1
MKVDKKDEYFAFQSKLIRRVCMNVITSIVVVVGLYLFIWKQRIGDLIVWILETVFDMKHEAAFYYYSDHFRGNKEIFFAVAVLLIFTVLMVRTFRWVTGYFREVNQGIESLLADDEKQIQLSPEMLPFERKLNSVKQTLAERKVETALAEQRKDELVMYLAHDIRTPLTSVIGYLNLLEEDPNMPPEQRAARVHIALEKAYRLETMVNEFFEITKYKSQKITLSKETIDLYYMLVQMTDEFYPLLQAHQNTTELDVDEEMTIYGDAENLARVFNNILKNAVAYSYPGTVIKISAKQTDTEVQICFQNKGKTIPAHKLESIFEKFFRLDESRSSNTGGAGLGLAIAKEIVTLHGGTISADSHDEITTFSITLPVSS